MKIRITGTEEECEQAKIYYYKISKKDDLVISCSVSPLYPNRGSYNQYRIYIDIEYDYKTYYRREFCEIINNC